MVCMTSLLVLADVSAEPPAEVRSGHCHMSVKWSRQTTRGEGPNALDCGADCCDFLTFDRARPFVGAKGLLVEESHSSRSSRRRSYDREKGAPRCQTITPIGGWPAGLTATTFVEIVDTLVDRST